jgi:hypothetical protein
MACTWHSITLLSDSSAGGGGCASNTRRHSRLATASTTRSVPRAPHASGTHFTEGWPDWRSVTDGAPASLPGLRPQTGARSDRSVGFFL